VGGNGNNKNELKVPNNDENHLSMLRSSQEDTTMLLKRQGEGDEVLKEI
jgi:hypothetical protein